MSPPAKLSRRSVAIGGIAVAGAALAAGAAYELPKLFKRRARGEYADLVNRLDDPDQAAIVGRALQRSNFPGDAGPSPEDLSRADLKKRFSARTLPQLMADDCAGARPMPEADGWVVPLVLAELCVLAAESV